MSNSSQLRREIEDTRHAFHTLLDSIADEDFSKPSDNPAWTVGEVLYHMSIAPRMMVLDVQMISGKRWVYRLIPKILPKSVFDWLNVRFTRFGARRMSRAFLANAYDQATASILRVLASLAEDDLARSLPYPDWDPLLSGEVTLAYLFGYIKRHFDTHAAQLAGVLHKGDGVGTHAGKRIDQ